MRWQSFNFKLLGQVPTILRRIYCLEIWKWKEQIIENNSKILQKKKQLICRQVLHLMFNSTKNQDSLHKMHLKNTKWRLGKADK